MIGEPDEFSRFRQAYLAMAKQANYRPAAPIDASGKVTLSVEELVDPERLAYDAEAAVSYAAEVWAGRIWREEAVSYANEFLDEKNTQRFWIRGGSHWDHHRALVYTIEAARQLNSGADGADSAIRLLEMALAEAKDARRQYQEE
jgi:hypothetical protein